MIIIKLITYQHTIVHFYVVSAKNDRCSMQESASRLDLKECVAYEVTSLAKTKVHMETNPAYEQVGMNQ